MIVQHDMEKDHKQRSDLGKSKKINWKIKIYFRSICRQNAFYEDSATFRLSRSHSLYIPSLRLGALRRMLSTLHMDGQRCFDCQHIQVFSNPSMGKNIKGQELGAIRHDAKDRDADSKCKLGGRWMYESATYRNIISAASLALTTTCFFSLYDSVTPRSRMDPTSPKSMSVYCVSASENNTAKTHLILRLPVPHSVLLEAC